jgi:hypothetical protein
LGKIGIVAVQFLQQKIGKIEIVVIVRRPDWHCLGEKN